MDSRIELLAPGGDIDSIKAAVAAGADAIYCGLRQFNARNRAANITFDELNGVIRLAHEHRCKVYLTLNTILVESDIPVLVALLNRLVHTRLDGVIVQDLGLLHLLAERFAGLEVHASTQLTTHNEGQLCFLRELGVQRVNLARELNIGEIAHLARIAHGVGMSVEVFVHGSYCISFSGVCYMSSISGGNSGNRGRCSQPCRDRYQPTPAGMEFPLNLKDNSAYSDLELLADAGVDALKIEGRMKKYHYVNAVVGVWSRRLADHHAGAPPALDDGDLYRVFNRGFSDGYLQGAISKEMYSEHPRNEAARQLRARAGAEAEAPGRDASRAPYDEIDRVKARARQAISGLSIEKAPLTVAASGQEGAPLTLTVTTPGRSLAVHSSVPLVPQGDPGAAPHLNREIFLEKLKPLNDTEYALADLSLEGLRPGLFLPYRELTALGRGILSLLNGRAGKGEPVKAPALPAKPAPVVEPGLCVLVSSLRDLPLGDGSGARFFFQIPGNPGELDSDLEGALTEHREVTPWFPSILVGEQYAAAVELLRRLRPRRLVTNNTGIALEAHRQGIPWVAGPRLNIANSLSLICLEQKAGCQGAFLSGELSMHQLRKVRPPAAFELYFSIYGPVLAMTSRQCLFQQVTGCDKDQFDDDCLAGCSKSASITDRRGKRFTINKAAGGHCAVYNGANLLNTDVLADLPGLFARLLIDLREIPTETRSGVGKARLIELFQQAVGGDAEASRELHEQLTPTTNELYRKGI